MKALKGMSVSASVKIHAPIELAWRALNEILGRFQASPGSAELEAALPYSVGGRTSRPVRIAFGQGNSSYELEIRIEAAESPKLFPQFHGVIGLLYTFGSSCDLRLEGKYHVPFGVAGTAVDRTLLRDSATTSLERFTRQLATDIVKRVGIPL
jgi:hypothetical protein